MREFTGRRRVSEAFGAKIPFYGIEIVGVQDYAKSAVVLRCHQLCWNNKECSANSCDA